MNNDQILDIAMKQSALDYNIAMSDSEKYG